MIRSGSKIIRSSVVTHAALFFFFFFLHIVTCFHHLSLWGNAQNFTQSKLFSLALKIIGDEY